MLQSVLQGSRYKILVALAACSACASATAQSSTAQTSANPPVFEAVVVKRSGAPGLVTWGVNQTGYAASSVPLARVLLDAYLPPPKPTTMGLPLDRVKDAPAWVTSALYDITCKADEATINTMKGMNQAQQLTFEAPALKAMLHDRFGLVAHTASTDGQGYALVVGKHGIRMKETAPDEKLPDRGLSFGGAWKVVASPSSITYYGITMAELVDFMGKGKGGLVDQTGLTARYDIELPKVDAEGSGDDAPAPDLAHAYDWGAVGLEMRPAKVPVMSVVIDHVERPTAN